MSENANLSQDQVIQLVNHIGDQEKHFKELETQYRLLASTWLLASLGAIGFLLKDDKSTWLDTNKLYLIGSIGLVSSLGIVLLWILDIKVYHKLLHSVFIRGILLELQYPWLPKIRTDMLISQETGDVTRNTGLYYIGSAVFLQVISLISFIISTSEVFNKIVVLAIGLLVILATVFFMGKSGKSSRAKMLYNKLKQHYKDDIDEIFLTPDSIISSIEETSVLEKYASRINFLTKGFENTSRLVTINKSEKNDMQVSDHKEWWYCLEGRGNTIIEDKGTYFFQPNGIIPITNGAKFTLQNKNQLPIQIVVFNQ